MGSDRKATEDANTFARCKHCGVRIGRSAGVRAWSYWNVVNGDLRCVDPDSHGLAFLLAGNGEPMFHEPDLPDDLTREGLEQWLTT